MSIRDRTEMDANSAYAILVSRNNGYISASAQAKIRGTRLLIAGCGMGSSLAICAARMGFENFLLVDGDVVDAHNLNRQFYDASDVGKAKVDALKSAILRINPHAQVEAVRAYLDAEITRGIVAGADIVFDTVDFLDLPAILGLHRSARSLGKPVFTAMNIGFGALVWYFPPDAPLTLADIIAPDLADVAAAKGDPGTPRYADVFASFIERLAPHLDIEVTEEISRVLSLMKEGRPCPASQIAVGSFAVAAMAMSMIHEMLMGRQLPVAPRLVVHSFRSQRTVVIDVSAPRP